MLLKILVNEGEVEVGSTIAVIGKEGEDVSLEAAAAHPRARPAAERGGDRRATRAVAPASRRRHRPRRAGRPGCRRAGGRVEASPLARRIARERGIDLAAIAGTGPDGRIVAEDVESAPKATAVAAVAGHCRRQRSRSCS